MKRETAINVVLVIAGIVLAIALFAAGVLWKRETAKSPKSLFVGGRLSQRELGRAPRDEHSL